jgi:hypothetical protein
MERDIIIWRAKDIVKKEIHTHKKRSKYIIKRNNTIITIDKYYEDIYI